VARPKKVHSLSVNENYMTSNQVDAYPERDASGPQLASSAFNLGVIFEFARRRLWVILFSVLVMSVGGITYFVAVPAPYSGAAVLKIDTRRFQLFQQPGSLGDGAGAEVESHLEALKSENLALKVIEEFHLADDDEFGRAAAIPIISNLIERRRPDSEAWRVRNALRIFEKHYTVERQGLYLIGISFESANAERSAQIANAIAQAYIGEQLNTKYEITREASKWLEGRIKELRDQVSTTEKAVIDYKSEHKIVDAGNGRLMTEQRLTDLTSQLAIAHAKTSEMRARLDRISAALNDPDDMGLINATATETSSNPLMMKLRTQYLDLAVREAEWSEKYGRGHLAVVSVRDNMRRVRASMSDELQRLREAYIGDYGAASEAEEVIEKQVQQAIAESQTSNEARVALGDLESSAENYKTLFDNFVKRHAEATEQQLFPYTEARLVTKATPPIRRTYRKSLLIAAMTPLMGLVLGIGLGALLDFFDRGFRTASQIEAMLGLTCITLVPLEEKLEKSRRPQRNAGSSASLISSKLGIASTIGEKPFSQFAEAIRTIKLAADLNGIAANRIVGMTSAIPDEGKSTLAAALAMSIAQVGGRAILVDCDLRNPSLSRAFTPDANAGVLEVLSGKVNLDEAVSKEAYPGMAFLPVCSKERIADSSELLISSAMKGLFETLRHSYDYIVVDLPPLAPLADVRATTHFVDSYLLVVDWGRTSTAIVQHALGRAPRVYERIVGVVLNKVDMKALKLYDSNRARYYYDKEYSRYGYTE
jgi:polysaccharide biosynthesis transport protein